MTKYKEHINELYIYIYIYIYIWIIGDTFLIGMKKKYHSI